MGWKKGLWFVLFGDGTEGVELFKCSQDISEIQKVINGWELRVRYNSHRAIQLFFMAKETQVTMDMMSDRSFVRKLKDHAALLS